MNVPQWIKNIWQSPKSTIAALGVLGLVFTELARDYPTTKWLGVAVSVISAIKLSVSAD